MASTRGQGRPYNLTYWRPRSSDKTSKRGQAGDPMFIISYEQSTCGHGWWIDSVTVSVSTCTIGIRVVDLCLWLVRQVRVSTKDKCYRLQVGNMGTLCTELNLSTTVKTFMTDNCSSRTDSSVVTNGMESRLSWHTIQQSAHEAWRYTQVCQVCPDTLTHT